MSGCAGSGNIDPSGSDPAPVPVPVSGEIDLHGFRPADVTDVVAEHLRACREAGILEVRLVHGRGRQVLARTVHATLARIPWVERFSLATGAWGGPGATVVRLQPAPREGG